MGLKSNYELLRVWEIEFDPALLHINPGGWPLYIIAPTMEKAIENARKFIVEREKSASESHDAERYVHSAKMLFKNVVYYADD